MTTAEIKSELNKAREAVRDYRLARDKANAYGRLLMSGKTVRYDSDGSTHERKENPVENAYCALADYETEADRLLQEMNRARQRAEKLIASVPDQAQREVLTRRYIIGQRWEDIAECMSYSRRRITQLHGIALKNISLNFPFSL
ncbi:MAG: hypothetical protein ACI4GX_05630 [Ruminococcus sp.]